MPKPLPNYLRTHRRRLGLSQDDIGFLMGLADGAAVSRYERRVRLPTLEGTLAIEAIYGRPTHELFPGVYEEIEALVALRARALLRSCPAENPACLRKRFVLEELVARAHVPKYEA